MPYCDVADDVALYYEDFGAGSPVVFTNAGNLTHKMWMGQVAALAPAFRTITYDIRGTGFSAKPRLGYTAEIGRGRAVRARGKARPRSGNDGRARHRHAHHASCRGDAARSCHRHCPGERRPMVLR